MPSWFHNPATKRCEKFIYGGCGLGGNANRFSTREACERACLGAPPPKRMQIIIVQCSDGAGGANDALLDLTQVANEAYARRYGHAYLRYKGVIRGNRTWMAVYNRFALWAALRRTTPFQWMLFLDADALIVDYENLWVEDLATRYADRALLFCSDRRGRDVDFHINFGVFFAHLNNTKADDILADCLDQLDESGIDQNADAEWESGNKAKIVNDQVMMRRALERRANRRGRVAGVKTFKHDDYDRFNYGGRFVRHFTREATKNLGRRETVEAATLGVLLRFTNRTTLPRPPDPRAKCYLSGVGADDIRPALFQALPC
ncbi:unnamed protein product [Pelagomonas calceolata]|uniref:BPTI/Kunitz inhibitor domain-containing protein n=1 Tax=Pelagomonas calceolata TaxID=35677 RepID=A0A8J2S7B0_9STRA|nr:unnamed protein product [Pelagomonas calceolata]